MVRQNQTCILIDIFVILVLMALCPPISLQYVGDQFTKLYCLYLVIINIFFIKTGFLLQYTSIIDSERTLK